MTIHCITPNPAIDVTYTVDTVVLQKVNRVREVAHRPGGKGVNVARLADAHGSAPVATYGFLGGTEGVLFKELLDQLAPGIDQRWTEAEAQTRRTIAVVDSADTTMLNESGAPVPQSLWEQLIANLTAHLASKDWVTISGSLPPQTDPTIFADIVAAIHDAGARVLIDTSGPARLAAARAGADILKPNRDELLEATGAADVHAGMAALQQLGVPVIITSMGEDGALLSGPDGEVTARLDSILEGNPTGAGDALVAGVVSALAAGEELSTALRDGIAWSASAVLAPVAGEIDAADVARLREHITA